MRKINKLIAITFLSLFVIIEVAKSENNKFFIPMIGQIAPPFVAKTTKGEVKFPEDYWNKWLVLFSHPSDFTPVCTSELMKFADLNDEFEDINCKLLGLSVDGLSSHIHWIKEIEGIEFNGMKNIKIDYPIIADLHMNVAKKYGMIQSGTSSTKTVRGVFIIDDKQKIQAVLMYPMLTGRNVKEILRLVKALQAVEKENIATPEGWSPGGDVFLRPILDKEKALDRFEHQGDSYICPVWFMCIKPGNK